MKTIVGLILVACATSACTPDSECIEVIDPACLYTAQYDPVCGCNCVTYTNQGHAGCSGITEFESGACN